MGTLCAKHLASSSSVQKLLPQSSSSIRAYPQTNFDLQSKLQLFLVQQDHYFNRLHFVVMNYSSNRRGNHDAIQWRISSYLDSFFALYGLGPERQKSQNLLIQFWAATNHTSEEGQRYCLLTTRDQPYDLIFSDQGFSSYRYYSLSCVITIQHHDKQQNQQQLSVPGRVYRNKMPEISPDISYYSVDDYPHRDFALSCGVRSSFCFPVFDEDSYECANGVLELVYTSDDLEILIRHIYSWCSYAGLNMITQVKYPFRLNLQDIEIPLCTSKEIDRVLKELCQKFGVPLAQCWVIGNHDLCTSDHLRGTTEALVVINNATSIHSESITSWSKFKKACWEMCMRKDQGVVGKAFSSQRSFFCRDITKLRMSEYPLAHFAQKCGTIACFTIYLQSFDTDYRDYVLEFFLPHKMDSNHTQTLLNAMLEILKEHLQMFVGEGLLEELNVEVVKSYMQEEPESFKIGESKRTLPCHVACANESRASTLVHCNGQLMMECGPQQDKYILDVEKGHSSPSFSTKTGVEETSERKFNSTSEIINCKTPAEIIDLDELGEGLPVKFIECNKPQSSSEAKRSLLRKQILLNDGESVEIDQQLPLDEVTEHDWHMLDTENGQPEGSPPCDSLEDEGNASQQLDHILKLLFEDGTEQDEHVLEVERSEETVTGETSKRTPDDVAGIISLNKLKGIKPIKLIEPWSPTILPKSSNEIIEDMEDTVEMELTTLEMTLEDAQKHKQHTVGLAAERENELVEESHIEAVGYATTTASQRLSFQTMKSLPQQQIVEETVVSGNVAKKPLLLEDVHIIQNKGITEKDGTTIQSVSETCIEDTSVSEKKSENDISLECLRKHFGRSLNDAAKSFGVSDNALAVYPRNDVLSGVECLVSEV